MVASVQAGGLPDGRRSERVVHAVTAESGAVDFDLLPPGSKAEAHAPLGHRLYAGCRYIGFVAEAVVDDANGWRAAPWPCAQRAGRRC